MQSLLELLLPKLLLQLLAERDQALVFIAVLGVVAAQSNQLLAYRTATVGLASAALGVSHYPLHFLAAVQATVCVSALTRMHQRLNTPLYGLAARL